MGVSGCNIEKFHIVDVALDEGILQVVSFFYTIFDSEQHFLNWMNSESNIHIGRGKLLEFT